MSQNPDSFKQNYETLQKIAQTLSQSDEIDIDELVPMVDEATRAYNLCKSRIEAVEAALNQRLETESKEETEEEPF
jgi:exodeoxyribonuclease VII small subunit